MCIRDRSPSVRAPVTAHPWVEACQFPRASSFGLPTAGRRTRAGLPRRFSRDPSSTPKRWLGQQAREDTGAWHRLPSLCDTSGALHNTRCPKLCQRRRAQPPTHRRCDRAAELRVAKCASTSNTHETSHAPSGISNPAIDTVPSHGGVFACAEHSRSPAGSMTCLLYTSRCV